MGLVVTVERNGLGAVFDYSGVVSGEEAYRESKALYTPHNLKYLKYQIVDLRQASRIEISTEEIKKLAELDKEAARDAGGFFIASIVDHDLQESLSMFYRTYANDLFIIAKIFRSMEDAREWLDTSLKEKSFKAKFDINAPVSE